MFYKFLADFVTILHAILIFGILLGILLSVRYKRFRPLESLALVSAVVIWSLYGGCPLTFLENKLRILAQHPIPLAEVGFIPFYFDRWFGLPISDYQLTLATYFTAAIFFIISIDWISPFVNFEIIKLRKAFGFVRK